MHGMLTPYVLHEPLINPEHRRGAYSSAFVEQVVDTAIGVFLRGLGAEAPRDGAQPGIC